MGKNRKGTDGAVRSADDRSVGPGKYAVTEEADEADDMKFSLYQRAVQAPKGELSYLSRFFLEYVGGRNPLCLHEDFCGTALICKEWLKGDSRRTAVGLDLDRAALRWGIKHNLSQLPNSGCGRARMLWGNVLDDPSRAVDLLNVTSSDSPNDQTAAGGSSPDGHSTISNQMTSLAILDTGGAEHLFEDQELVEPRPQQADIVCAFNFSTCCLHSRSDLLHYFQRVLVRLRGQLGSQAESSSNQHAATPACKRAPSRGGVFAMDLYGGTSSECYLKLHRSYGDFDFTWEQEEFDAVTRMTSISLHFRLRPDRAPSPSGEVAAAPEGKGVSKKKNQKKQAGQVLKKAFNYRWRLWTIPEVRDCLLEAGFDSVKVWMRQMPDLSERESEDDEVEVDPRAPFEEVASFFQCDSWNAYVVGICKPSRPRAMS